MKFRLILIALCLMFGPWLQAQEVLHVGFLVGYGKGQASQTQIDGAIMAGYERSTQWGVHLGYIDNTKLGQPVGAKQVTGTQIGLMYDAGRAFWIAGGEKLDGTYRTTVTNPNGSTFTSFTNVGGTGAYVKVGYKLGFVTLYGSYGQYSKGVIAAGFVF